MKTKYIELKTELKQLRKRLRSLIRPREPNIHVLEQVQKEIEDIKNKLIIDNQSFRQSKFEK